MVSPAQVTAYGLLAREPVPGPTPTDIVVPPQLLADLDAYPLIITADYVGVDRRAPGVRHRRDRAGTGPSLRGLEILIVVVATMAVVIPLTLLASSHAGVATGPRGAATSPATSHSTRSGSTVRTDALRRSTARGTATRQRVAERATARAALGGRQRARQALRAATVARRREARARRAALRRTERRLARLRHRASTRGHRVRTT